MASNMKNKKDIKKEKLIASAMFHHQLFDAEEYEPDYSYSPWKSGDNPLLVHTFPDLLKYLESNKKAEISAKFFSLNKKTKKATLHECGREKFLELGKRQFKLKETMDSFAYDKETAGGDLVGDESIPLIGGPFNKNLYVMDYIKMANAGFYAYHNDPFVRRAVQIIKNFTLGRGYRVDCKNKKALALWKAFEQVNDFEGQIQSCAIEIPIYGEFMLQWLKAGHANITYNIPEGEIPRAIIPRVRVIDPSTIWEIITYPEDITRVLYYQQIFPTQYQIYTADNVPSVKFIYQQLPGDSVDHYKINSFHNEKRGRSDLYPILGYAKRLRDCVNYALINDLKNSSWSIDTTVEGSQADIDAYKAAQEAMGTIPQAGGEFIHTAKIKREHRFANASTGGASSSFEWALSCFCSGIGLPISYFGTHIHGGSTRATAIVSTEPVSKLFEDRQALYEKIILRTSRKLFDMFGFKDAVLEVSFPEIITQDRSAKLKDLALAVSEGWLSKHRAAEICAKEFGITDFDFDDEKKKMAADPANMGTPPVQGQIGADGKPMTNDTPLTNSAITSDERKDIKNNEYSA